MKKDVIFYGLIVIFFIILLINPNYDFSILNSGIYFRGSSSTIKDMKDIAATMDTLFAKEGLYGYITVEEEKDNLIDINNKVNDYDLNIHMAFFDKYKTMKINGKIQCSTGRVDAVTTGLLGGLPIVLEKNGDALNIGLGCGMTLGVLEKGDFDTIDTIEIDPVVIEASKKFNNIHNNALDDPRSNLIIDDARNFLLKTNKKYDVIVNEPSHPYNLGSSNLLTNEFFLLVKDHIKDDGVIVQWVPTSALVSCDQPGFAIFYKTFSSVFPNNYVFISKTKFPAIQPHFSKDEDGKVKLLGYLEIYDHPDSKWKFGEMIFVGSLTPIDIRKYIENVNNDKIKEYFQEIMIFNLKDNYVFSNNDIAGFSEDVGINTDNKPIIEFLASKNLYTPNTGCPIQKGIILKGDKQNTFSLKLN